MTDAGKSTRVERAAENAMLKLLARGAMVLVIPMGAFFGSELWSMGRKASEAIIEIRGDIRVWAGQFSTRADGHETRLTKLENKNDQQDDKIGDLQQRLYQIGSGRPQTPAPLEEQQRQQWQRR
jgi:hypothetical protein